MAQVTLLSGFGSSCSQPLFVNRPSYTHGSGRIAISRLPLAGFAGRKRLDEMEDHLTDARAAVLDGYGRWVRALEDIESLWALGAYLLLRLFEAEGRRRATLETI